MSSELTWANSVDLDQTKWAETLIIGFDSSFTSKSLWNIEQFLWEKLKKKKNQYVVHLKFLHSKKKKKRKEN